MILGSVNSDADAEAVCCSEEGTKGSALRDMVRGSDIPERLRVEPLLYSAS